MNLKEKLMCALFKGNMDGIADYGQILALLKHPHIIKCYGGSLEEGKEFLVLELMEVLCFHSVGITVCLLCSALLILLLQIHLLSFPFHLL